MISEPFRGPHCRLSSRGFSRRCHEASEPAEVIGLDVHSHPRFCVLSYPLQNGVAGGTVDLEVRGGVDELRECPPGVLVDHPPVLLYGGRVRVDLDDRRLGAVLVDVGVDGEQTGVVRLQNLEQLLEELPEAFELALLNRVGVDDDERCGHADSLLFSLILFGLTSVCVVCSGLRSARFTSFPFTGRARSSLKCRESCTRCRLERSVSTQDPPINIVSLPPVALGLMHTPSTVDAELWTGASRAICRGFATKRV